MNMDEKLAAGVNRWLASRNGELTSMLSRGESPIEQLFLLAALNDGWMDFPHGGMAECAAADEAIGRAGVEDGSLTLYSSFGPELLLVQAKVVAADRRFRLDFAMLACETKFAIELDGHDFHERTKEQARHDKSRDRALTLAGWRVLRFAGSEVYANANKIISDLEEVRLDAIDQAWERANGQVAT